MCCWSARSLFLRARDAHARHLCDAQRSAWREERFLDPGKNGNLGVTASARVKSPEVV